MQQIRFYIESTHTPQRDSGMGNTYNYISIYSVTVIKADLIGQSRECDVKANNHVQERYLVNGNAPQTRLTLVTIKRA